MTTSHASARASVVARTAKCRNASARAANPMALSYRTANCTTRKPFTMPSRRPRRNGPATPASAPA